MHIDQGKVVENYRYIGDISIAEVFAGLNCNSKGIINRQLNRLKLNIHLYHVSIMVAQNTYVAFTK